MMSHSKKKDNRRVVITGLGVVSSLGIGWKPFWKNLLAGKSGISKITAFNTSQYDCHYGGEVKNFDPARFMHKKNVQHLGRTSQMAIAASKLALKDGKLNLDKIDKEKVAVYIGTTAGEIPLLEEFDDYKANNLQQFNNSFISVYPASSNIYFKGNDISADGTPPLLKANESVSVPVDVELAANCTGIFLVSAVSNISFLNLL